MRSQVREPHDAIPFEKVEGLLALYVAKATTVMFQNVGAYLPGPDIP